MKDRFESLSSVRLMMPVTLSLIFAMVAPLAAQCGDPAPPPGGFPITEVLASPVTYGDGAKTLIDVRYPSTAPGRCGWPVVILVHPLGAPRSLMAADARSLSAQGYFTAAYDVRGQGAAFANPPSQGMDWFGENVRLDLVQIVHHVRAIHGGTIADVDRLGITGLSQGGVHAWIAAAWSGKPLPPNTRGIATFPTFLAAVPAWAPPVDAGFFDPRATSPWVVRSHAQPAANGVRWQTSYFTAVGNAIASEDFAALHAMVQNDPWRADLASLASTTVPVLAHLSWNDSLFAVDELLRAFAVIPPSTPKRMFLSAPGHDEPWNTRQQAQLDMLRDRWFARFLKGENNAVELEPAVLTGVVPDSLAQYRAGATLLWNRYLDGWPPAGVANRRYYLRQNGQLAPTPPAGAEPSDRVQHTVPPQATMAAYVAAQGDETVLLSWIPLSSVVYDTAVLSADVEIAGSVRAELEITPAGPDYQIGCALYQVDATNVERYLQSGAGLVRGDASPRRMVIDFTDLHACLKAGSRLRLKVENLTRWEPPAGAACQFACKVRFVPYFRSVTFGVEHSAARMSWIEVPLRAQILPALSAPTLISSVVSPADVPYTLEAPANLARSPYLVLLGASGIAPPASLAGEPLHLVIDPVTLLFAGLVNTPFLPACAGTLSASGQANPVLALSAIRPFPPELRGARFAAAAVVLGSAGLVPSNPLDLFFR